MSATVDLRNGLATAYDALRAEFLPGVTVLLLKPSEDSDEYDTLLELENKWFFEYSKYRGNFGLEIADDNDELTSAIAAATHVKVNNDVYVIADGDTIAPQGTNPVWQLFCTLFEKKGAYSDL